MTKAKLINIIAEKGNMQHKQSVAAVNLIFSMMTKMLAEGNRIEIRGFGSFVNRVYKGYEGRNPKTGENVHVPEKCVPFFKVGKELKEMVDYRPSE